MMFLLIISMGEHVKVFEDEIIDIETLQEITRDDLISIGVKAFDQRPQILNTSKNIVDTLLFSDATQNFSCKECNNIFNNIEMLKYHMETSHNGEKKSSKLKIVWRICT